MEWLPVALGSKVAQLGLQLGKVHPGVSLAASVPTISPTQANAIDIHSRQAEPQ